MTTTSPTARKAGLRWHLRTATQDLHAEADRLGQGFDLRSRAGYRSFLRAHARALPALEAACDAAGLEQMVPDWPQRRRRTALEADLARLGAALPPAGRVTLPSGPAALGAAYVLEGSRLGNAMLLRIIQNASALANVSATAYLSHMPGPEGWPGFLGRLEQALPEPTHWAEATAGARLAFDCFLMAMHRERMAPLHA
ncbi:biliverdin-producing heme oxygenase [Roseomonas sp. E05]|uniref:biliverdin-producing heme oxygenase n=1 Tax=Roseomonas sp. E05 TaxID=3046310 RepID=UPI0024BB48CA|nr:biliverdin-producing heme oxygenase [Roseomonas sp. E05]MDJ0386523.1 biliverdin-producing heme oxygenase [Roseomonas sp. E05]